MTKVLNYNSTYPLSFYQEGTIYAFYAMRGMVPKDRANADQIQRFAHVLDELKQQSVIGAVYSNEIKSNQRISTENEDLAQQLTRFYGVVVGKRQIGSNASIIVMFLSQINNHDEYCIMSYAASSKEVATNGKNLLSPSSYVTLHTTPRPKEKAGEITLASHKPKVQTPGNITLIKGKQEKSVGSSGVITKSNEPKPGVITWSGSKK